MAVSKRERNDKTKATSWLEVVLVLAILTILLSQLFFL